MLCVLSPIQSRHFRSPFFLLFDSFFLLLFSTEKRRVPLLPSGYYTLYSMPCEFKNLCDSLSSSFVYIIAQEKSRELDMWVLGKDKPTYFCLFRPFFFLEKTATRLLCNKQNNLKNRQSLYIILYPFFPSERGSLTHLF